MQLQAACVAGTKRAGYELLQYSKPRSLCGTVSRTHTAKRASKAEMDIMIFRRWPRIPYLINQEWLAEFQPSDTASAECLAHGAGRKLRRLYCHWSRFLASVRCSMSMYHSGHGCVCWYADGILMSDSTGRLAFSYQWPRKMRLRLQSLQSDGERTALAITDAEDRAWRLFVSYCRARNINNSNHIPVCPKYFLVQQFLMHYDSWHHQW